MMRKTFFTIPNILTLIRIALIPLLVYVFFKFYTEKPFIPAFVYIVMAFTDLLDGYIAKNYNMISDAGKVLDPLADKLFINTMLFCFVLNGAGLIITLLFIINLAKEVYFIIAATLLYRRKFIMSSKLIGKIATLVLNLGVIIYFLIPYGNIFAILADVLFLAGLILSICAGVYYTVTVYKQTGGHLPPKQNGDNNG